jgi:hypothetical protein
MERAARMYFHSRFGVEDRTEVLAMTTQAPSRPPASYESWFFSALILRRWLTRVAVDRDSSGNHESTADRPTGSGEKAIVGRRERVTSRGFGSGPAARVA